MTQINIKDIIENKNPEKAKKIPGFVYSLINWILRTKDINNHLKLNGDKYGIDFVESVLFDLSNVNIIVKGKHNIPEDGKLTFVSNHPLGGLDGLAFIHTIYQYKDNIVFPVNDFLTYIPNLKEFFIPINKVGRNSRENILQIEETFASDKTILYFPAGLCSRKIKGKIVDLEWKPTFVKQSVKYNRDIIPVYINGKNSNFFYNLANLRAFFKIKFNIEMMFLPREMFKQNNKEIVITIGEKIPWQSIDKSHSYREWAKIIKEKTYNLKG
ncbi:MAG: 1-acyl-sn-glycerol-3-phosphate acyltransferase [Bacteroidales bacterium]|jgi:putative hemolysin